MVQRMETEKEVKQMDELVRKQDALDAIHCDITVTGRQNAELVAATIGAFADRIKALPPVQPKHGKWIDMPYGPSHTKYMCSECGKTIYTNSEYIKEHKFCFSCGADMRCSENPNS